jgi:hypothetical protein
MDRAPVRSSNMLSVGYDPATRTLEVQFHSGGIYQYSGVPDAIHLGLMGAASKGAYFQANIKDRYPCKQVR